MALRASIDESRGHRRPVGVVVGGGQGNSIHTADADDRHAVRVARVHAQCGHEARCSRGGLGGHALHGGGLRARCNRLEHACLAAEVRILRHRISDDALSQLPDYHQRVDVLQRRGFIDSEKAVQLKVSASDDGQMT